VVADLGPLGGAHFGSSLKIDDFHEMGLSYAARVSRREPKLSWALSKGGVWSREYPGR
jgi:hypothetical protein